MCKDFVKNILDNTFFGSFFRFIELLCLKLKDTKTEKEHFFYILTSQIKDKMLTLSFDCYKPILILAV
jgi:hypothetical protein